MQIMRLFSLAIFVTTLFVVPPVQAQAETSVPSSTTTREQHGLTNPAELESFIDGFMLAQMESHHIAGVTISVVKDGNLFFAKGYGYADVHKHVPVDPATTLFRIGSIGKTFTWTAVMQLAEQGKLDLNADVNRYLDFNIPATYPEPITLSHLLTHTAGFEDRVYGLKASAPEKLVPLGTWLAHNIPARVRRPGEFASYSNYGASLAGYIVERVSGIPYDEYIETKILQPLGMANTTSRQPLPGKLAAQMSRGYTYADGMYRANDFELYNIAPAGSISASATDMARFMIAHLQHGRYGEARILKETTVRQMQRTAFTHDQRLNGITYGFFEQNQYGQPMIAHGGDTDYFHSLIALLPVQQIGIFVSTNSATGSKVRNLLLKAFMDRYYHLEQHPIYPLEDLAPHAARVSGSYRTNRRSYATWENAFGLFVGSISVSSAADGTLRTQSPDGVQRFVETEPLVFHEIDGDTTLIFREDAQGNITYAYVDSEAAFERQAWHQAPLVQYLLLGIYVLLLVSVGAASLASLIGRRRRTDCPPQPGMARAARWLLGGVALLSLSFIGMFLAAVSDTTKLLTGEAAFLNLLGLISILLVFLTIGTVIGTVLAWKNRYWGYAGRVHYTLGTLAALGFIWFLQNWNLLVMR